MPTHSTPARRPAFDLGTYQRELDAFMAELGEAWFAARSGQRPELVIEPIYAEHAGMFDDRSIDALRERAAVSGDEARTARALLAFAIEGRLERDVVRVTEQIDDAEASAVIVWRHERLPYRTVPIRVAEISDRRERNGLNESYLEAIEAINPLREERYAAMRAAMAGLGYADEVALAAELHGVDLPALAAELRHFLADSETVYFAALRRYLAEIDIEQGDGSTADLGHLLRGRGWDAWFDAGRALPAVTATLAGLGIDLAALPNVTLDLEPRPTKTPRAFAVPVRVPGDVRMTLQPRGGYQDYRTLLHELGHVLHFAHVDAQLPAAWRHLGDNSVTEGYAFVFDHLLSDPGWLDEHLGIPGTELAGWLDFEAFRRLFMLRRYTAKLLYELRLDRDGAAAASRAYYAGLLGLLTGLQTPEAPYLADVDDHFYSARYLRAWMLEASLSASLRSAHGDAWWRSAEAGASLARRWSRGQEANAEDVVADLGYDHLDWRPVLRQIRTQLIGEMSGYGGPNITTRAGTRKV
jgi:hypothetical protein